MNLLGSKELLAYKKEVESNFKVFKSKLAVKDKESVPKLPEDEKEWYVITLFISHFINNLITVNSKKVVLQKC